MNSTFRPCGPLHGRLAPPADKSISHRAAILAAMGTQPVRIGNYLLAADTSSTLAALRALGADVQAGERAVLVRGRGLRGLRAPAGAVLDVGNAGTLMRLLPGWLAFQQGASFTLDGDASIRRRPVDRIAAPLGLMGARIEARENRFPPFTVHGEMLSGIDYELPVASAQVKSCVLLAALGTADTTVVEPIPTRDHTERMLLRAGVDVRRAGRPGGGFATSVGDGVGGTGPDAEPALALEGIDVPGDLSSAAFMIAAAVLVPGSDVVLERVGVNWTRTGFLRILARMRARVAGELEAPGSFDAREPITDLEVRSGPLVATTVDADEVPLAIDELPLIALLGCFASGETIVRGAAELRVKESDRIATVVEGLRGLGASIEALDDGFVVRGTGGLRGGRLDAHGDHRLALLGAVAGLASADGVEVVGIEAADVSYPGFASDLARLAS
jgi:3-phosphoshikimate 1-carboxyvinyltransferase